MSVGIPALDPLSPATPSTSRTPGAAAPEEGAGATRVATVLCIVFPALIGAAVLGTAAVLLRRVHSRRRLRAREDGGSRRSDDEAIDAARAESLPGATHVALTYSSSWGYPPPPQCPPARDYAPAKEGVPTRATAEEDLPPAYCRGAPGRDGGGTGDGEKDGRRGDGAESAAGLV